MYCKQNFDDYDYGSRKGNDWDECNGVEFFSRCEKKRHDDKCDKFDKCDRYPDKPDYRPDHHGCNICDLINWKELFKCCCEKKKPEPKPEKCFCCKCFETRCKD